MDEMKRKQIKTEEPYCDRCTYNRRGGVKKCRHCRSKTNLRRARRALSRDLKKAASTET